MSVMLWLGSRSGDDDPPTVAQTDDLRRGKGHKINPAFFGLAGSTTTRCNTLSALA